MPDAVNSPNLMPLYAVSSGQHVGRKGKRDLAWHPFQGQRDIGLEGAEKGRYSPPWKELEFEAIGTGNREIGNGTSFCLDPRRGDS